MSHLEYILCKWRSRLWPAKILRKKEVSSKTALLQSPPDSMGVELLGFEKQIRVKCSNIKPLDKTTVEDIAGKLGEQSETSHPPLEEITYRKALRQALDILKLNSKHSLSAHDTVAVPTVSRRESKARLPPTADVNGSQGTPLKKAVKKGSNSDGCVEQRRSPRFSSSSQKDGVRLKDPALRKAERNAISTEASHSDKGVTPRTSKQRSPLLKTTKQRKGASPGKGSSSPSLGKGKKMKLARDSIELSVVPAAAIQSPRQENTPVSGFRHSRPSTAIRNVSTSSHNTEQKWGGPCKETEQCASKQNQGLAKRSRSTNLNIAKCKPKTSLLTCNQNVEEGRFQTCPNPFSSTNSKLQSIQSSAKASNHALSHTLCKATKFKLPDFVMDEKEVMSSDLSTDLSSSEFQNLDSSWMDEEDDDDDDDLPSVLQHQEPCSFESGMLVWCKYYKYPYWPVVVNYVRRKVKKASVLFVEESLADPTKKPKKGVTVALKALKHFDCDEKQDLTKTARKEYGCAIDWCIELIADYRIRLGCGSFSGSFTEYCAAEISYPVRKKLQREPFQLTFPIMETDTEDSQLELTPTRSQPVKKCLPDRTRAARDKTNEKLVEYIVKMKCADNHLLSILNGERKSLWLHKFQQASRYVTCVDTYLEDDNQLEEVVDYLHNVYDQMGSTVEIMRNGDKIRFILDVLLPEAIICAISAVDKIDYKKAEEKYNKGPLVSKREREIFEEQILEQKMLNIQNSEAAASDGH